MGRNLTNLPISASFQYLLQVSGSEVTDGLGVDVDSLTVTASHAEQADSATSAATATIANTASYVAGANVDGSVATATLAANADNATSASFATTASFALNVIPINTGSFYASSSINNATITFTQGDGSTEAVTVNNVVNATSASYAATATSASHALASDTSISASHAVASDTSISSSHAVQADNATTADSATTATSASHALIADDLVSNANINISTITASNASFTSASIGYLQTITGSATIIGDAYVIVNSSDATRYAGIKVYESGAAVPTTASLNFDSQTNDWFYEYTGSDPTNFGVVMFGPEYATKGSPVYPTANTLVKGNGGHHVVDSSITDDGTTVNINADISASGFISASTYYGDGSQLTGVSATAFPHTGSAGILADSDLGQQFTYDNPAEKLGFKVKGGAMFGDTTFATDDGYVNFQAGERNVINGGQTSFIGGARENTINNNAENAAIIGANSNTLGASRSTIQASNNSTLTHTGTPQSELFSAIIGGKNHTLDGYSGSVILGGIAITASAHHTVYTPNISVVGNSNVEIGETNVLTGVNSLAIGNLANTTENYNLVVGDGNTADSNYQVIFGANNTGGNGGQGGLLLGQQNTSAASVDWFLVQGSTNHVGHTNSAVIGGTNMSSSKADETTVNHLTTNGQVLGSVSALSIASTTASMDCSTGNFFTLTLAAGVDTHLDATNVTAGQTINLKLTNNAITAGTISFSPDFEFEGGTAFAASTGTSEVDVLTFISFDGTSLQATGLKNFS